MNREIIEKFREFIQKNMSMEQSQKFLIQTRNILIEKFNLKDSRCIWMCLLLYKFKQQMEVSEELWIYSRKLIIQLLENNKDLPMTIDKYLEIFKKWQSDDLDNFVSSIAINYFNLLEIKNSIESTGDPQTLLYWSSHYNELLNKIQSHCKNIGIDEKLEKYVSEIKMKKYDIVSEIMNRAYWDKIESDIKQNDLEIIYNNLSELKIILRDIIPKSENTTIIDEYIDIDLIKQIVTNDSIDRNFLSNLFIFVMKLLKEWDSYANSDYYDKEIKLINEIEGEPCYFIRYILEKITVRTFDLKNRKELWNVILNKK